MKENYVVVTGVINVDIGGTSSERLYQYDSNAGSIEVSIGGAGKNIATNIALLGIDVKMLTALGDDYFTHTIKNECNSSNINLDDALVIPGRSCSTYLYINNQFGELQNAIFDTSISLELSVDYFKSKLDVINQSQLLVIDANISQESLIFLANNVTVPLFVDPVSTGMAEKLIPILDKIHTLKPNRHEVEVLTGISIKDEETLNQAAQALLDMGVTNTYISLDKDGVYYISKSNRLFVASKVRNVVNVTGAGDSFLAALVWAHLNELELEDTINIALHVAAKNVECAQPVNKDISSELLHELILSSKTQ